MTKSTCEKGDAQVNTGARRTMAWVSIGVAVIAVGALATWKIHTSRETPAAPQAAPVPTVKRPSPDVQKLIGRWMRTDTPYVLEIQGAGNGGKLQAAYYNPRPINVSVAEARDKDGKLEVYVELRDVGYPGSTYTLTYDKGKDLLHGVYFQATMKQSYNVAFMRAPAEMQKER